ncbi:MAG: FHA domain-containing protein [Acidimicrobiia bacterium]|nr:FHA domain-containing protein [bacterium]MXZ06806.1 FHA domain-containing protein [Acidimicrobiia bacterium]MYF26410.1 FHA domain-containing protein [Acidimicrobiia bacterium]
MSGAVLVVLKFVYVALAYLLIWKAATALGKGIGINPWSARRRQGTRLTVVRSDTQIGRTFVVKPPMILGRGEGADVHIGDPYASDLHVRLDYQDGLTTLVDLDSAVGTYVNGKRVLSPTGLAKGDSIQIGKTVLEVG